MEIKLYCLSEIDKFLSIIQFYILWLKLIYIINDYILAIIYLERL